MSSLITSTTECRDAQPSSATLGLNTRIFGLPGKRVAAKVQHDSNAPSRSSSLRAAASSSSKWWNQAAAKVCKAARCAAGTRAAASAVTASMRSCRLPSLGCFIVMPPVCWSDPQLTPAPGASAR